MAHKLTNSVTMDISPFAWSLARAVHKLSRTQMHHRAHHIALNHNADKNVM